jgi:ABC-type branched-subunit amino acid transport system ATPase component
LALLSVDDVTRRFGGIVALDEVTLAADEGTITGLIGPNGAGKTTLFNVITRLYKPDQGRVVLDGQDLLRTPPYRVVRRGVARTFQNVALFPTMTVTENVLVGAHTRLRPFGERKGRREASPSTLGGPRRDCRSAPSSASSWRARSSPGRGCCSWTSRRAG